jgi:O-antigen/teichoic acid export membrane protein
MLAKYGSIQLIGKFLPGLIGFFAAAALTRLLPPAQYGVYGLVSALAQLVALSAFGWLGLAILRLATGRAVDNRFAASVFVVFVALAALAAVCGALVFLMPVPPGSAAIAGAVVVGGVVFAYFDVKSSFFTASFDFASFLVLNVVRAAMSAAAALVAAYYLRDGLAAFLVASMATLAVCLLFRRPGRTSARGGVDRQLIARMIAFGTPIAGSLLLFSLSAWSDRLILGIKAGSAAVGFYTAAAVLVQSSLQLAAQAIGSAAYPLAVVAYDSGNRFASDRQLAQNFIVLLGIVLPGAVALSLLVPNITALLIGPEYREPVIRLTPLLACAAAISGVRGNFVDHAFQLTGSTWHYVGISADMAVVSLAALLLLVPNYGYMGAGFAAVLTAVAGFAHAVVASRRVYRLPLPMRDTAKVVAAVLAMALVLGCVSNGRGAPALCGQIGLGFLTYSAALWSLNLLNLRQATRGMLSRWLAAR